MNKKISDKRTIIPDKLFKATKQLIKIKEEARSLGIFVDDRELIECPKCGLMEDIDSYGRLFTVFKKSPNKGTGLKFKEMKNGKIFHCPNCGEIVSENVAKILEEFGR
ncbi:MAG: hypothetical protein XE03_1489 [candidate division TA06 bacterium 34_109]|uniref:Uncharacterized protein n=1 Tax=candidate division TA06 bacterium 34_109 TaxID=1635277 RepID=A0A101I1F9_UNCT6|nr:MAG: hypothetical protein XE03_1489 [candidate division TA06 bacterium 34_109]